MTGVLGTVLRIGLRAFVGQGLIERCDAKEMLANKHSGFLVNAGVCIESHDRAALERLLPERSEGQAEAGRSR